MPTASSWRFSLRTLFLLTLLVAIAVWVISWPLWDMDERILLATWFMAVAATITRSRQRGRRGIWQSGLAGGLVPTAAVLFFYVLPDSWVGYDVSIDEVPGILIWVVFIGSLAGMLFAAAFTPGGLTELSPSQREDRLQGRLVLFVLLCVPFVLLVGVQSLYTRATAWKFRGGWNSQYFGMDRGNEILDLAADGSHLAVVAPLPENRLQNALMIWRLEPFDVQPILTTRISSGSATALASHGQWIAIMEELDDKSMSIAVLNSASGKLLAQLNTEPLSYAVDETNISVSADAKTIRVVARSDALRDPLHVLRWRTDSWKPVDASSGKEPEPIAETLDWRIVEVPPNRHRYRTTYQVEIRELGAAKPVQTFGPFDEPYPATYFPDRQQIAVNKWIIDLASNSIREIPAVVRDYLPDGKRLLCTRTYYRESALLGLHIGRVRLPLVRRLFDGGGFERFVIVNAENGRELRRSQRIHNSFGSVILSDDGKTIVTYDSWDVLVWELPN